MIHCIDRMDMIQVLCVLADNEKNRYAIVIPGFNITPVIEQ